MNQTPNDNTYTRQPEFIDRDHRTNRPTAMGTAGQSYTVSKDFMYRRHSVMLPIDHIANKTILDVGSCFAATGAWCLDNGAAHYTGIEPQATFANGSKEVLGMYYKPEQYEVVESPLEDFKPTKKYDVVVASGVIYGFFDPYEFVRRLIDMSNESVVIETAHPFHGGKLLWKSASDEIRRKRMKGMSIIQIVDDLPIMIDADSESNFSYYGVHASVQALTSIFRRNGWEYDKSLYENSEKAIPEYYDVAHPTGRRYMARFYKSNVSAPTFSEVFKNPIARKVSWHDAEPL